MEGGTYPVAAKAALGTARKKELEAIKKDHEKMKLSEKKFEQDRAKLKENNLREISEKLHQQF